MRACSDTGHVCERAGEGAGVGHLEATKLAGAAAWVGAGRDGMAGRTEARPRRRAVLTREEEAVRTEGRGGLGGDDAARQTEEWERGSQGGVMDRARDQQRMHGADVTVSKRGARWGGEGQVFLQSETARRDRWTGRQRSCVPRSAGTQATGRGRSDGQVVGAMSGRGHVAGAGQVEGRRNL